MSLREKLLHEQFVQGKMAAEYNRVAMLAYSNYMSSGVEARLHECVQNTYKAEAAYEKIEWIQSLLENPTDDQD